MDNGWKGSTMETNEQDEQPEGTGPKPEEPSLRDVVRAIDGLTSGWT